MDPLLNLCGYFSKFERLFKKNIYNSIIQFIAHLKLWLFPIFLEICRFHPKRTTPAWWPKMNQAKFWYPVLMWTVFQWGRSASTGRNGSQKGQGLGYKAGGVKRHIHMMVENVLLFRFHKIGILCFSFHFLLLSTMGFRD